MTRQERRHLERNAKKARQPSVGPSQLEQITAEVRRIKALCESEGKKNVRVEVIHKKDGIHIWVGEGPDPGMDADDEVLVDGVWKKVTPEEFKRILDATPRVDVARLRKEHPEFWEGGS